MGSQADTNINVYADLMLKHIPVGVALYDAQELRLLTANPLYHKFLNQYVAASWKDGRTLGLPLKEWLPEEEVIDFVKIFRTVAETGIPYHVEGFAFHTLDCGMTYWNWTLDPVRNSEGHISHLLVTARHGTEPVLA